MKEAFYFSHDYNARNDQKILTLRGEYGLEGYALFFMILETMAEEDRGYIYRGAIGGLGVSYSVTTKRLLALIEKCIEIHLLYEDEIGIYSKRMMEHKKYRKTLSEQGKKGAEKRWKNSPPISPPNSKERKGKEIKENNINKTISKDIVKNTHNFFEILKDFEETKQSSPEQIQQVREMTDGILEGQELYKFYNYWVETGQSGKQRWQTEKTFELKRRMQKWKSNIHETKGSTNKPIPMVGY